MVKIIFENKSTSSSVEATYVTLAELWKPQNKPLNNKKKKVEEQI